MDKMQELSQSVENINKRLSLIEEVFSIGVPLTHLAKVLNISNQTLHYHLKSHYKISRDFCKNNGKIYVDLSVVTQVKEYYAQKH